MNAKVFNEYSNWMLLIIFFKVQEWLKTQLTKTYCRCWKHYSTQSILDSLVVFQPKAKLIMFVLSSYLEKNTLNTSQQETVLLRSRVEFGYLLYIYKFDVFLFERRMVAFI
jgi:hypothetical protein